MFHQEHNKSWIENKTQSQKFNVRKNTTHSINWEKSTIDFDWKNAVLLENIIKLMVVTNK